jgi:hypothetical protein
LISLSLWIKQQRKGLVCFLQPYLRPVRLTEGDANNLGAGRRNFILIGRNLRRMIATRQSSQMAEENNPGRLAAAPIS